MKMAEKMTLEEYKNARLRFKCENQIDDPLLTVYLDYEDYLEMSHEEFEAELDNFLNEWIEQNIDYGWKIT